MPNREILKMCEKAIRKDLGSLDDFPYEVANTVANVYYRFFNHAVDVMKQADNNPGWIPKKMKRETDMLAGLTSFFEDSARFKSDFEAAPRFVKGLRDIDKHKQPNLYQFTVDFILDCLKYNIKDAQKKTGLRRMVERRLRKGKVREIPNLVDLLDVCQKKEVNIEEIGANLAAFALDPEDISLCLQELPETIRTDETAVENELRYLRVFAVDFAITRALGKSTTQKEAVSSAYLALLQQILEKLPNSLGQVILEMLSDRIDTYVDALHKSPSEAPLLLIGQIFAKFCGDEGNIDLVSFGKEMFLTTSNGAVEYLSSIAV